MAETAAALYAVETVIEGAAVGAFAVSRSTVPLHVRFRAFSTLLSWNSTVGHSLSVVKGKAYAFGGDVTNGELDANMRVVTLPSNINNGQLDFQQVKPELENVRPLQKYATSPPDEPPGAQLQKIDGRAFHVSTIIDTNVFILAGRIPKSLKSDQQPVPDADKLFQCDHVYSYSTQLNKWKIIHADTTRCENGIPVPRVGASCTSTPHPQPDAAVDVNIQSHGTIFLHGGFDAHGQPLRDTWTFDINSKVWSRWPDLPNPLPEEMAGEGRIACVDRRLWRAGDGFGKMMYIDFSVTRGGLVADSSGPQPGETSVIPQSQTWTVLSFAEKAADTALQAEIGAGSEKALINNAEILPSPRRGAGFVPVSVGAGRMFLLYFMGQDGPDSVLGDVWSFQVQAERKSPAAMKDSVRSAVGKETGENQWARCEIIESTKKEGLVHPPRGLTGFAADVWHDLGGGNVVLWGGADATGAVNQPCWIMSVE